jgi:hypothetical protein
MHFTFQLVEICDNWGRNSRQLVQRRGPNHFLRRAPEALINFRSIRLQTTFWLILIY